MGVDTHRESIGPPSRLVVLQPSFLPWLGHLDQYVWADTFVMYDDTQFDKNGWRNRNRILGSNGVTWLTVPVKTKGLNKPLNTEVPINNQTRWQKKMLATIRQSYSKLPYFEPYFPGLEEALSKEYEFLIDLNMATFRWIIHSLDLRWKVVRSSQLEVPGRKTERLVALCEKFEATDYLTGDAARDYLDERQFEDVGVKVHWHNYVHPVYDQGNEEFVPYLSVVDLLFREGPRSADILSQSRKDD
jgi:WbqC-like protein